MIDVDDVARARSQSPMHAPRTLNTIITALNEVADSSHASSSDHLEALRLLVEVRVRFRLDTATSPDRQHQQRINYLQNGHRQLDRDERTRLMDLVRAARALLTDLTTIIEGVREEWR